MADTKDLTIQQGKTFSMVLRWETEPVIRKPHLLPNSGRQFHRLMKDLKQNAMTTLGSCDGQT